MRAKSSEPSEGRKVHWTQTPKGRKRMAAILRERHRAKRAGPTEKKAHPSASIPLMALAKRVDKLIFAEAMRAGEFTELTLHTQILVNAILGK